MGFLKCAQVYAVSLEGDRQSEILDHENKILRG
jgi:hypothetical protein